MECSKKEIISDEREVADGLVRIVAGLKVNEIAEVQIPEVIGRIPDTEAIVRYLVSRGYIAQVCCPDVQAKEPKIYLIKQ